MDTTQTILHEIEQSTQRIEHLNKILRDFPAPVPLFAKATLSEIQEFGVLRNNTIDELKQERRNLTGKMAELFYSLNMTGEWGYVKVAMKLMDETGRNYGLSGDG